VSIEDRRQVGNVRPIRVRARAEVDGEIHLRGLPIAKGEEAEVIVLTVGGGDSTDKLLIATLQNDPAWSWLKDSAEDIYDEGDIR
jgi:hypothetical protein